MEYKFYGQFDPPVDKYLFENFFVDKKLEGKGLFIECGAFDGETENSCKFFEETLGWNGINVEPSPVIYQELIKKRPDSTNVNVALSNYKGKAKFTSVIHPTFGEMCTNGSLHHGEKHKETLDQMGCTYKEYEVNVITYPQLIERYNVRKVDLFVLDVEGNELQVIDSMKDSKILPKVFCVEHGNLDQQEVVKAVEDLGYRFVSESFVNSFFVRLNPMQRIIRKIIK